MTAITVRLYNIVTSIAVYSLVKNNEKLLQIVVPRTLLGHFVSILFFLNVGCGKSHAEEYAALS